MDEGGGGRGGGVSNVRIEGVACSSTRLGNKFGDLNGEEAIDGDCCRKLARRGDDGGERVEGNDMRCGLAGAVPGLPLLLLREDTVSEFLIGVCTSSRFVNLSETIFVWPFNQENKALASDSGMV